MIRGFCKVVGSVGNITRDWPEVFVAVPRVGEWVKSASGKLGKVVGVIHCTTNNAEVIGVPTIEVEIRL
jgi:hypothetical protein